MNELKVFYKEAMERLEWLSTLPKSDIVWMKITEK